MFDHDVVRRVIAFSSISLQPWTYPPNRNIDQHTYTICIMTKLIQAL